MEWKAALYLILLLLSLCLSMVLLTASIVKRKTRSSIPFGIMMTGLIIWTLFSILQIPFNEMDILRIVVRFEYIGIVIVPTAFLAFSLSYSGFGGKIKRFHMYLLLIEPLLVIISTWTNDYHELFWTREETFDLAGILLYSGEYGILFWIHTIYSYVLLLSGGIILVAYSINNFSSYMAQSLSILLGLMIPLFGNLISITGLLPIEGLDITPISFVITGFLFALSIFKFDFLDLTPVARAKVLEAINEGVIVIDNDNRITDINPAGMMMLKISEKVALGKPIDDVLPLEKEMIEDVKRRSIGEIEIMVPEQNCWKYYRLMFKKMDNISKKYHGNVIIVTDITIRKKTEMALKEAHDSMERKVEIRTSELVSLNQTLQEEMAKKLEAEKKLKFSKERYKELFSNAPIGIYRTSPDGQLLNANMAFVNMLGYPDLESLLKVNLKTGLHGPDYPRKIFEKLIERDGKVSGLEMHWRRYDGSMIFVRENAKKIRDKIGNVICYEGTVEDITNNKKQAEMIRRRLEFEKVFSRVTSRFVSEKDLHKAIDSSLKDLGIFVEAERVCLFTIDEDNGCVVNTNEWFRMGNGTRKDLINGINRSLIKLWINIVPIGIEVPRSLLNEDIPDIEKERIRKAGIDSMLVQPLTDGKKLMGFIGMERKGSGDKWTRDEIDLMKVISEVISGSIVKNRAEERMKKEWQRAEFYLDLINHDLGNINQGLLSRVQMLPFLKDDMVQMEKNIDQLDQLIRRSVDLLKRVKIISEIETKPPNKEIRILSDIIDTSLRKVHSGPVNNESNISVQIEEGSEKVIAGDLLSEAVSILVDNALKVQKGEETRVKISASSHEANDRVCIYVDDWGPGISDENKESLLERKMRMGEKMMTGLGLSTVKVIVESYNGKVWIEDRVEGDHTKGCRFAMELERP
jgi:PAS domain S-box-containing protein